jgi:hypothetical protein
MIFSLSSTFDGHVPAASYLEATRGNSSSPACILVGFHDSRDASEASRY